MDFINKLLDENYDWGDKRIDEDVYDELSAELIIDYLKKHDSEIRQMLALSWNFDNPKKVIQWIVEQPDTDKGTCLLLYWRMAFNPCHDSYQDGYDWTASLNPSEFKIPIPQEMFTALDGIALDVPSWEEGIPEDLQPAMDRLADLVDE